MLYFSFNIMQSECISTESSQKEDCSFDLGDIQDFFFEKLEDELHLSRGGIPRLLCGISDIPSDAFSIDDEAIGNTDGVIKFVLSEYAKLPIKKLDNKSLNDLGIRIEFCKRFTNEEIDSKLEAFIQTGNFTYVTEDVLWKNMTADEQAKDFSQYLINIGSNDNELIIIDPYLFYSEQDDYCGLLASIIKHSRAKTIIAITDKRNCKESSVEKIRSKSGKAINIKYSGDFHDRFWIANRTKGFYTGTSLNGVGKRISLINMIPDDDVAEIIKELREQSVIS